MPTYEYECKNCGNIFEQFHGINENPHIFCPKCGKDDNIERLISAGSGLIFKGSGFYITDYKNKNNVTSTNKKEKASHNF